MLKIQCNAKPNRSINAVHILSFDDEKQLCTLLLIDFFFSIRSQRTTSHVENTATNYTFAIFNGNNFRRFYFLGCI